MIIGIDIDDTITITSDAIKSYIINNFSKFNNPNELINDIKYILGGGKSSLDIDEFLNKNYATVLKNVQPRKNVIEVLNKIKQDGNKIILITARSDDYINDNAELITREYLKTHKIPYDILITNSSDKKQISIDNDIDIMIDDSVKICESFKTTKIKTLLFTTGINENITTNVLRVDNWLEIYNIIKSCY